VLRDAIAQRPLTGARDLAAVIDARIRDDIASLVPLPADPWSAQVPEGALHPDYAGQVTGAMDARKDRLGEFTAQAAPLWAVHGLGPVPEGPLERLDWEQRAAHVAAYRELLGYDHPAEPIGPEPSGDSPEKRAAWHAAFGALGPIDGVDVRGEPDGRLPHRGSGVLRAGHCAGPEPGRARVLRAADREHGNLLTIFNGGGYSDRARFWQGSHGGGRAGVPAVRGRRSCRFLACGAGHCVV
jgi:hypothetical protein